MMRLRSKELSCPSRHDEIYGAYKTIIYMNEIIGRKKEISELKRLYASRTAEFVAIYGRRRVGKTFLVDEALSGKITFRHAGLSPVDETTPAFLPISTTSRYAQKPLPKELARSLFYVGDALAAGFFVSIRHDVLSVRYIIRH